MTHMIDAEIVVKKIREASTEEEATKIYQEATAINDADRQALIKKGGNFLEEIGGTLQEILNSSAVQEAEQIEEIRDQQLQYIAARLDALCNHFSIKV